MINAVNLNKSYKDKVVLDSVSIELLRGKFTSIIGANGSGKSTLLSMISRMNEVDSGYITLNDKDISTFKREDFAKEISILKQSNNPHMRFTIRELIEFGRFPYSKGKLTLEDHQKVEEVITYFNIRDIADLFIDRVSGGQKQLAFIAMLAAQDTDYMLLDEPLNNLDIKHSIEVMNILQRYAKEYNKSIVLVIHDINFASRYSDNIIALKDGKVVISSSTDKVIQENVLKEIYDVDFAVKEIDNKKMCLFY